jgi:hypothetical protein
MKLRKAKCFYVAKITLVCLVMIIGLEATSHAYATDANVNGFQSSFNLFTGCTTAKNLLVGTPYYDNDCKTDISIWRPGTTGQFWVSNSSSNSSTTTSFGTTGDKPLGGDYDGDGLTDIAVYRTSTGEGHWHLVNSSNGIVQNIHFGTPAVDLPVPADFNGDGKTDTAVFRLETSGNTTIPRFFYRISTAPGYVEISMATENNLTSTLFPVVSDYDNDGKSDAAIWRNIDGLWEIITSGNGQFRYEYWGASGDIPVPGNYAKNGVADGVVDLAYFRPSTGDWHIANSNGGTQVFHFGTTGDKPVPGDYDGDGVWDFAVKREVGGNFQFHIMGSSAGYIYLQFGVTGDIPIAGIDYSLPSGPIIRCGSTCATDACPREKCGK